MRPKKSSPSSGVPVGEKARQWWHEFTFTGPHPDAPGYEALLEQAGALGFKFEGGHSSSDPDKFFADPDREALRAEVIAEAREALLAVDPVDAAGEHLTLALANEGHHPFTAAIRVIESLARERSLPDEEGQNR